MKTGTTVALAACVALAARGSSDQHGGPLRNSTPPRGSIPLTARVETHVDKKLQLLDSFQAQGTDGASYKVMAYEHLRRVDVANDGQDHWEPVGLTEYRLASGERVDVAREGVMRVVASGVELRPASRAVAPAGTSA